MSTPVSAQEQHSRVKGKRVYELGNHLDNVLATVSDRKLPVEDQPDGMVDWHEADVFTAQDYYAFGMGMPEREMEGEDFRFGFQGQEKDDEVKGRGSSIAFSSRSYEPRNGRFLTIDPHYRIYNSWSPYLMAGNSPIRNVDYLGQGVEDRIKAARSLTGIEYKQERAASLRIENTKAALEYMDCSEFVCRVLAADNLTEGILHLNTGGLKSFLSNEDKFVHSSNEVV